MCYMTRQLFPSPSQGALICAGGGKEGLLAAALGSGRAEAAGPSSALPSSDWLPRDFLQGLQTPRGIQLLEAERGRQARPSASTKCPLGGTAGPHR